MSGSPPEREEFTERNVRWRLLLLGAMCGVAALLAVPPLGVAAAGAALILLGIAVFIWRSRRIGGGIVSIGLGVLAPSTVPPLLSLLDSR
ncbi:hypothetical protein [Rhodococcus aetherivorans]|uniref:hypothetical protein n=1 Tax=Rhodococcus aetherivorans TaxID=191292 RepID=UPI0021ADBD84|nr:hypothetical protein [Rhodococcus aetherivorans]